MLLLFSAFGTLVSLSLVSSAAASGCSSHGCHGREHGKRLPSYSSVDRYKGSDFLNDAYWTFFTDADPSGGQVRYLSREAAQQDRLAYVQGDNKTVLRVDSSTNLPLGAPRNSVRISSTKKFHHGLIVADFNHMPFGCSVWPAFWLVGDGWPLGGEIDIVEGVNNKKANQYTFHTGANQTCNIPRQAPMVNGSPAFTGTVMNSNCSCTQTSNIGCSVLDASSDEDSYGEGFANAGGGIFALSWDNEGIKIWHFDRSSTPQDIYIGTPDPNSWTAPNAFLSVDNCAVDSFFLPQNLILDITLCGSWAASDYPGSGCPGTCTQQVTTGSNYVDATWVINSITVYNA